MHTVLMAEIVRARSEELQRRAASVRMARAAGSARHPRRRPRIRRRLDLASMLALPLWTSRRRADWRSPRG
jgi:hypothetical protein